ncbi:gas vesicle protein [Glycomyces sp. NPDC049804]|uniref:gas vesicle protein n=1 Tax=Glycomyces sp. NPDC049804 TaxID=3154363 RepID=UPI00341285E5
MTPAPTAHRADQSVVPQRIALVDLLDRVLATGVVVTGEVTISIAGVDLVYISLQALISSVRAGGPGPAPMTAGGGGP